MVDRLFQEISPLPMVGLSEGEMTNYNAMSTEKHAVFVTKTSQPYKYYCHFEWNEHSECNREISSVWIIIRDLSTSVEMTKKGAP